MPHNRVREISLRSLPSRIILLTLIILGLFLAPGLLSGRAALVYVPGVKPGDNAVYAQTVGRWNLPGPPDPIFAQFINLNFTTLGVTSVNGSNVTAAQTFTYVNGTVRHDNILGSVATDGGNITFWFTAANLTAGNPIYMTANAPVINRTMTLVFAGAPRTINIFNTTVTFPGGTEFVNAWWDQITGILVHVDFAIKTTSGNAFAGAQLVRTNLWNAAPNQGGIGLVAFLNPLLIAQGFSNSSVLQLISEGGFSGNVTITASIPGCASGCPTAKVNPNHLSILSGGQSFSVLNVSTTPATGLGFYSVLVMATSLSSNAITNSTSVGVNVVSAGPDEFPTAVINFSPPNPIAGQPVFFSSAGSVDPDGFIVSYNWTFSDRSQIIVGGNTTGIEHTFATPGLYDAALTVTDSSSLRGFTHVTVNVVSNVTDEPPFADFLIRVPNPGQPIRTGQFVTFDASPSFDPDGFIQSYSWSFGDGFIGFGEIVNHSYNNPGNFTVVLTVTDSSGKSATAQHAVTVEQAVQHDVGIVSVDAQPKTVVSGQQISVGVGVVNLGQQSENVDISVRLGSMVVATLHGVTIPVTSFSFFFEIFVDTTGIAPGNYTVSASVFLATDQNPSNNMLTDGTVTILPPPVLSVTPSQGAVGATVKVHGSGFPSFTSPFQGSVTVEVTFDDQFIGFTTLDTQGSFDFVFNIPVAQSGPHMIHAYAELFPKPVEASTGFTVVPGPATISLTVSVGTIYFPGDTAVVYVLSTANGSPAKADSISLLILFPNGTSKSLTLVAVSTGVYKASYLVPGKNSIGTYGLVATSQLNGASASALSSFEVKPTWLQSNSRNLAGGVAVAGVVGLVALSWKKGYFTRRKDEFPFA